MKITFVIMDCYDESTFERCMQSVSLQSLEDYEVIVVGPGGMVDGKEVAMMVKKGQRVLVGKYSGTTVKVEDEEYSIVRQSDILAIVE